jgi:WD40 repeat protein
LITAKLTAVPWDLQSRSWYVPPVCQQVDKVYFCAAIDKYITCARDGTFRLWQASDLDYVKTVNNGTSWITDCLYLPQSRKMVFTTMDRAITYYDIARWVACWHQLHRGV